MTHTTLRAIPAVLFLLALFGLATTAWAGSEEENRELIRQRIAALTAGDAEALAATYADDAQIVRPGRAALRGRAAIQQSLVRWFRGSSHRQVDNIELDLRAYQETVVVIYATYTLKWIDSRGNAIERRRLSTSTRVKRDGRWQVVSMHVSNLPR